VLKTNKLCVCFALTFAPLAVAEELSSTGEFIDGIAAIVDDGVVLKSQLAEQTEIIVQRAQTQNIQLPPAGELRDQLLERLIITEVQLQRAQRIGLRISDAMVNESIENIAMQNNIRFEDMPAALATDGIDYAKFRRDIHEEIVLEQLRRADVGNRIAWSERELAMCLADLENNVAINSDYNLSNITLSMPESASATVVEETMAEAQLIIDRLGDGADFAALAIRYSDAQNALDGGALGWLKGEQLPSLYTNVVAALEPGDVTEPIRAPNSFHIVKVNDMRGADDRSEVDQVLVRHILVTPNEIIDDETAKQRLDDALEKIADGEEFGAIAKLLSDDPGSANNGGEMDWTGPGTFVPEFDEVVAVTEIGEISEPFQSRFGWHVVEVMDRRVYDNTEDLKKGNCIAKIRNGKMEEETQLWIQRLRDEAYVDIRI
jgi:peptidyl-prolyl cis-trans isomerase SurA